MPYKRHEMNVILFSKEDTVFGTDVISDNDNIGNISGTTYTEEDDLNTGGYNPYTDQ